MNQGEELPIISDEDFSLLFPDKASHCLSLHLDGYKIETICFYAANDKAIPIYGNGEIIGEIRCENGALTVVPRK